jgi:metal-dependent amidase/aminoacylase/carboxypeptidase family protein
VVTVGRINGGVRSNIVPEEAELIGTLRALRPSDRALIHERVRTIAENVGEAMGATVDVTIPYTMSYPVTYNDTALTRRMVPVLERVAGADHVRVLPPETGAEDFSFFAEKVPGFYFTLGGRPADITKAEAADHHTPDFFVDESALKLGVRAMTALAVEYLRMHTPRTDR